MLGEYCKFSPRFRQGGRTFMIQIKAVLLAVVRVGAGLPHGGADFTAVNASAI